MTKEKNMTIIDCLNELNKKELDELYKNNEIKTKKRATQEEKQVSIFSEILTSFMMHSIVLTDKEIKDLGDLIDNKAVTNISPNLLNHNFVFNIKNNLIVPFKIKEAYEITKKEEIQHQRKNLAYLHMFK